MSIWLKCDIDTPSVLINLEIVQKNVKKMAKFASDYHLNLRPHIKTHKMEEIAAMQIQAGAVGITTAKLSEAETFAKMGIKDILIAYPIIGQAKLERLRRLMDVAKVMTVVDGFEQAAMLNEYAIAHQIMFNVLIEIDTGLHRCGVIPGSQVLALYGELVKLPGIRIQGIMTHAGHAYGAKDTNEVRRIAEQEGNDMVETSRLLEENGYPSFTVSVGSTPTVYKSGTIPGVTEIRPGNYVFNDMTQVRLGVSAIDDCSLRVAARVVAKPAENRLVVDAGAKSLALDQGAHGTAGIKGYGMVVDHPELTIARLSEEHGIVEITGSTTLKVGDLIEIIPNHSCPVVNLADEVQVVKYGQVIAQWRVAARGNTK